MKRYLFFAFITLISVSCNKNDFWDIPLIIPKTFYAQASEFYQQTRSGDSIELNVESWDESEIVNTKSYAVMDPENSSEYYQYWTSSDAISLFFTTENLQYVLQTYKDGLQDIGVFELAGSAIEGAALSTEYYYSVYPYKESTSISKKGVVTYEFSETQHYNGDSYANGENGMMAIEPKNGTDSVLYFQNFCSYLQLRLFSDKGQSKTVKKITLVANNITDAIAGQGTVEIKSEADVPVVKMKRSATNQITLDCGAGITLSQDENNPTKFWFVVPGDFTFTEGFSISVIFDDYSYNKKVTSKQISIERSHIKPMAAFNPISTPATSPIRYKYNDSSVSEPFPFNNTFFGADGKPLDIVNQIYDEKTGEWLILLSGTLKSIGDNSFEGPGEDLEYIKVDNDDESIIINNFAFYNCTADYIEISNDVDEINESAFTGSTIKDLNITGNLALLKNSAGTGSSIENINITGDVHTIQENAFAGCSSLTSINISGEVTCIESQAFSGCNGLQTVDITSVETIGYRAFYMCGNLTDVTITGTKYINDGAFRSCTSLETITLDSVITIGDNAFMDCKGLTYVEISKDCTMIGEGAFCNAINLETVYCYAEYPPFIKTDNYKSSYVFDNVHPDICIYIPAGSEDYYLDSEYFVGHEYEDPNIEAEVNWWYEEYGDILLEMEQ